MKRKSTVLALALTVCSYPLLAQTPNPGNGIDVPPVVKDVNVVNTPGVTVDNIDPLSVSVEGQTWEPFTFAENVTGDGTQTIYAPTDKRLIISSISSVISTYASSSSFHAAYVTITTWLGGTVKANHFIPIARVNTASSANTYVDTRNTRILLEPGEHVTLSPRSPGAAYIPAWQIVASGYTTPPGSSLPPP